MQIGAFIFPTEYSIRIDELARGLEERGFESLFVTGAHPTSRRAGGRPGRAAGPCPRSTPTRSTPSSDWRRRRPSRRGSASAPGSAW